MCLCSDAAGFSGAELANVVNEAALLAGRQAKNAVEVGELVEGVQRTKCGLAVPSTSLHLNAIPLSHHHQWAPWGLTR